MEKIFKEAESKCTEKKWAETIYKAFFNETQIETETIKDFTVVVYKNKIGYAKWNGIQPKHRCIGFAYAFYRVIGRKIPTFYKMVELKNLPNDTTFYFTLDDKNAFIKVREIENGKITVYYEKDTFELRKCFPEMSVYIKEV